VDLSQNVYANRVTAILILVAGFAFAATGVAAESTAASRAPVDSIPVQTSLAEPVAIGRLRELDLNLLGTVLSESGDMMAIIKVGKTGEQELYWLGDSIEDGRITKILRDRITLAFADLEVELLMTGIGQVTLANAAYELEGVQPPLSQTDGLFWRVDRATLDD
jgi:hypothetical protein